MKKVANTLLVSALIVASTGGSFAAGNGQGPANAGGGKNWTAEKSATIDRNRNSNAGIGDGGERWDGWLWGLAWYGEDGGMEHDPGNSGAHNQACSDEGAPKETSC